MNKIVVTYKNADLDCVASAYAYAEYLTKTGTNASYFISGLVQDEVNIVCKLFNILLFCFLCFLAYGNQYGNYLIYIFFHTFKFRRCQII